MTPVPITDVALLIPALILVGMAFALLLGASRIRKAGLATTGTVLAALAAALASWLMLGRGELVGFSGMITVDGYSQFFKILIAAALALTALLSVKRVDSKFVRPAEYHALLLLASTGMMIASSSLELMTLYLGLELTTLCSYVLVGITVDKKESNEAAIKDFLLGSSA